MEGEAFKKKIGIKSLWIETGQGWSSLVRSRSEAVLELGLTLRTVPDYCVMGLVANATGLVLDCPVLHMPLHRPTELADAFQTVSEEGMLEGEWTHRDPQLFVKRRRVKFR